MTEVQWFKMEDQKPEIQELIMAWFFQTDPTKRPILGRYMGIPNWSALRVVKPDEGDFFLFLEGGTKMCELRIMNQKDLLWALSPMPSQNLIDEVCQNSTIYVEKP